VAAHGMKRRSCVETYNRCHKLCNLLILVPRSTQLQYVLGAIGNKQHAYAIGCSIGAGLICPRSSSDHRHSRHQYKTGLASGYIDARVPRLTDKNCKRIEKWPHPGAS